MSWWQSCERGELKVQCTHDQLWLLVTDSVFQIRNFNFYQEILQTRVRFCGSSQTGSHWRSVDWKESAEEPKGATAVWECDTAVQCDKMDVQDSEYDFLFKVNIADIDGKNWETCLTLCLCASKDKCDLWFSSESKCHLWRLWRLPCNWHQWEGTDLLCNWPSSIFTK